MDFSGLLMMTACLVTGTWVLVLGFCFLTGYQPGRARCMSLLSQRYFIGSLFAIMMTYFVFIFLESRHLLRPNWIMELAVLGVLVILNTSKSRAIAAINVTLIVAFSLAFYLLKKQ
jgi:hypothetical protein